LVAAYYFYTWNNFTLFFISSCHQGTGEVAIFYDIRQFPANWLYRLLREWLPMFPSGFNLGGWSSAYPLCQVSWVFWEIIFPDFILGPLFWFVVGTAWGWLAERHLGTESGAAGAICWLQHIEDASSRGTTHLSEAPTNGVAGEAERLSGTAKVRVGEGRSRRESLLTGYLFCLLIPYLLFWVGMGYEVCGRGAARSLAVAAGKFAAACLPGALLCIASLLTDGASQPEDARSATQYLSAVPNGRRLLLLMLVLVALLSALSPLLGLAAGLAAIPIVACPWRDRLIPCAVVLASVPVGLSYVAFFVVEFLLLGNPLDWSEEAPLLAVIWLLIEVLVGSCTALALSLTFCGAPNGRRVLAASAFGVVVASAVPIMGAFL
jgi:hypothetical protein